VLEARGGLPFVAEDLGIVTREVEALRDRFGLPGLRVLQFAFDGEPVRNTHLPHRYPQHCVAYTGTHDNDTATGWFRSAPAGVRARVRAFGVEPADPAWGLIRLAMASAAALAVVPLQDVLGLGSSARMNTPGTPRGNWTWRVNGSALTPSVARRLSELTHATGRAAPDWPGQA
jgi:4-alpha-glucanotransferase